MFLRLFENFVKFPFYSLSLRQAFPLLSPSGKVARSADRGLFKISPYVAASPCLHKILPYVKPSPCFFLLSQKSAKIVSLFHRLPLEGKVDKAKLWTNEGRNLFSIRIISIKWHNLFALLLLSPANKAARSADRGQPLSQTKPLINSPARPASIRTQE